MKTEQLDWAELVWKVKKAMVPNIVSDYNNFKDGVNRAVQMQSVFLLKRKSVKVWYKNSSANF